MTHDEHKQLFKAVAAEAATKLLEFANKAGPELSYAEVGEILVGIGAGLLGFDLKTAGAVAKLRELADGLERAAVNPDACGRTN